MPRSRRYRPTARRKMIWARATSLLPVPGTIPAVGTAVDLLAQFRADGGDALGCTVTRVRIDITLDWNADFSIQDQLAVGVLVDQVQPFQAEVPRPGDEEHADWMYWRRTGLPMSSSGVALPLAATSGITTRYMTSMEIDVQSQRKMEELGQTLWLILDPTFDLTTTLNAQANSSVLLKLP